MDSNAKNKPAMGAPNPALMPAADPAAIRPNRRDAASEESVVSAFAESLESESSNGALTPATSATEPATAAPISTLGPSGPSDDPDPSVTTAARAFSVDFPPRVRKTSSPKT